MASLGRTARRHRWAEWQPATRVAVRVRTAAGLVREVGDPSDPRQLDRPSQSGPARVQAVALAIEPPPDCPPDRSRIPKLSGLLDSPFPRIQWSSGGYWSYGDCPGQT